QRTLTSEPPMSTINHEAIARRLTRERLGSYLASRGGDLEQAIALYDWNAQVGGALHEDIGRLEACSETPWTRPSSPTAQRRSGRGPGTGDVSSSRASMAPGLSTTSRRP